MFFPTALLRDEAGLSHALIMEWTGGVFANWSCLPVLLRGHFFSRGFLLRLARRTVRGTTRSLKSHSESRSFYFMHERLAKEHKEWKVESHLSAGKVNYQQ